MENRYFIGIDTASNTSTSKGALVTMKQTAKGIEVVKVMRWHDKYDWIQKLKVKFYLWYMTNKFSRYFKNVTILKETNKQNKATEYFKKTKLNYEG